MQLNAKRTNWGIGAQRWLGSAHGTDAAQSATLDKDAFAAFAEKKLIPAGVPVKQLESGKFGPVTAAGDKLAGFVFTAQSFDGAGDVLAPVLEHGRIRTRFLPAGVFDVTKLTAQNPRFVLDTGINE